MQGRNAAGPALAQRRPRDPIARGVSRTSRPLRLAKQEAETSVSVVVPHGGRERLPLLTAMLAGVRQCRHVGEVIVVELGAEPLAREIAQRWADVYLFGNLSGPFDRARALNMGAAAAEHPFVLWCDNDLLLPPDFLARALREMARRNLDYLVPHAIDYMTEGDSAEVRRGARSPLDCRPAQTLFDNPGACGLLRRSFFQRRGGLIEGFRGWGAEDLAWEYKVRLMGQFAFSRDASQRLAHLFHPDSGGYGETEEIQRIRSSPEFARNVDLLCQIQSARTPRQLEERFPPSQPWAPDLMIKVGAQAPVSPPSLPVWLYWEGPCPEWIKICQRTILRHVPGARLLTPRSFDEIRDRDRDIDLSPLSPPHRADFIRAFLLARYGGLWIDSDCLVMRPLSQVLEWIATHGYVAHRELDGRVSNGFIGARPDSAIAQAHYLRVCEALRSGSERGWYSLGSDPLTEILDSGEHSWHEIGREQVQPIPWTGVEEFFAVRPTEEHEQRVNRESICYMFFNQAASWHREKNPGADLLAEGTFFRHLAGRSLGAGGAERESAEVLFAGLFTESAGPGSTLESTAEIRARIPLLLADLGVRTLLDISCNDFGWQSHMDLRLERCFGVDVVPELIRRCQERHGSANREFFVADLIRDELPACDLILCRDFLVHLSFDQIFAVLRSFRRSGARWLLMTAFTNPRPNEEIPTGDWRPLNFELPPFGFPSPERVISEKCREAGGIYADKSLGLWELSRLPL